jgi:hypothetical protein
MPEIRRDLDTIAGQAAAKFGGGAGDMKPIGPRLGRALKNRVFVLTALAVLFSLALSGLALAQGTEQRVGRDARTAVTLTVYTQDLALIDEVRRVDLGTGRLRLVLEDVAKGLQPETVILQGGDLRVLERSFDFDLLTPQRLLEASVGQKVRVVRTHPQTGVETVLDAELLSIEGGPVLRIGDRIETAEPGRIVFDTLPEGVRERPSLLALVESARAAPRELSLRYLTGGLSWRADYVATLNPDGTRLDLTALIAVTNASGVGFEGASLRLVAGAVNRAAARPKQLMRSAAVEAVAAAAPRSDMPVQRAVSDRYLYSYDRPVDLADRETKLLTLFQAPGVAVTRRYRFTELVNAYRGVEELGPVQARIVLEVENTEAAGLGRPLPGGTLRVYEAAAGGPIFTGEDRIAHTAEGETLKVTLGRAFDVTGEARQTAFEPLSQRSYETAQEVVLRNAKDEAVEVRVIGTLSAGWKMLSETAPHKVETANRIAWTLQVPAKGETKLSYRVRVSQ